MWFHVNVHSTTPDKGFETIYRYTKICDRLFDIIPHFGFVPETHVKSVQERVKVTYDLWSARLISPTEIKKYKTNTKDTLNEYQAGMSYPLDWAIDSTKCLIIDFKGYQRRI